MPNPGYTHIQVLLDRSGSMTTIREDMEGGFNTFLDEQKGHPGKATIGLDQFDDVFETVYRMVPIAAAEPLHLSPRGSTALVDAMVTGIDKLGRHLKAMPEVSRPGHVIFVIITDGYENASTKHNRADANRRISHQRDEYGWQFIYLGANQDAVAEARSYGISGHSAMTYDTNPVAVGSTYNTLSSNVSTTRSTGAAVKFNDADRKAAKK